MVTTSQPRSGGLTVVVGLVVLVVTDADCGVAGLLVVADVASPPQRTPASASNAAQSISAGGFKASSASIAPAVLSRQSENARRGPLVRADAARALWAELEALASWLGLEAVAVP